MVKDYGLLQEAHMWAMALKRDVVLRVEYKALCEDRRREREKRRGLRNEL